MSLLNDALRKKKGEEARPDIDHSIPAAHKTGKPHNRKKYYLLAGAAGSMLFLTVSSLAWLFWYPPEAVSEAAPSHPAGILADNQSTDIAPHAELPSQRAAADASASPAPAISAPRSEAPKPSQAAEPPLQPAAPKPSKDLARFKEPSFPHKTGRKHARSNSDPKALPKGRPAAAAAGFSSVPPGMPSSVDPLYRKAQLYYRQGRIEEAIAFYREVLRREPQHFDARFNLAAACLQAGQYAEARRVAADLYQQAPGDPQVMLNLAIAQIGCGLPGQALELLDKAARQADAPLFEIYLNTGVAHRNLNQLQEAVSWYRKAEQLKPHDPRLLFNLAVGLDLQMQYGPAAQYYRDYIREAKNSDPEAERQVEKRIRSLLASQSEKPDEKERPR